MLINTKTTKHTLGCEHFIVVIIVNMTSVRSRFRLDWGNGKKAAVMWLFIARWQYFSADGASTRLHQRRRRESSFFLVGWRDLVADLRTCIELVGFVFFFILTLVTLRLWRTFPRLWKITLSRGRVDAAWLLCSYSSEVLISELLAGTHSCFAP